MNSSEKSALIIVDLQVDFCSGGALAVPGGDEIAGGINSLMSNTDALFKKIILTADWHPEGHISFASSHSTEPFSMMEVAGRSVTLWPDHCIEGTNGSSFYKDLQEEKADLVIRKGRNMNLDSYSAFYENDKKTLTGLSGYLKDHGIDKVYICGLALDWCVFFSAMDSMQQGFNTSVIMDLTRAIDLPVGFVLEREEAMKKAGIGLVESSCFNDMQNGEERS